MWILTILVGVYVFSTLIATYIAHQLPRRPVEDKPDWGTVLDTTIAAIDGRTLEVWRVDPEQNLPRGIVVLAHGWGRNRDRMVYRARILGKMGFVTVMHSARDHGSSSPKKLMNGPRFAEDIESVIDWVGGNVILYGHSAGAIGSTIAASRNPERIDALILEGCYARTKEALRSLYWWVHPIFGFLYARMILFWMDVMFLGKLTSYDPTSLAPELKMPVMLVHGEKDARFPPSMAKTLQDSFLPRDDVRLFVAPGAGHSDSSTKPGYREAITSFLEGIGTREKTESCQISRQHRSQ